MTKVMRIDDGGFVWEVPAETIAKNRATYYAKRDKDTTYQEEFDYTMSDDYELRDWFLNNMDWEDVEKEAQFVASPAALAKPDLNESEIEVVERIPQGSETP